MFSNFAQSHLVHQGFRRSQPTVSPGAKRENRPARVVSRCRRFTSRTRPTRPSRFCRPEENTFPAAFKIFESTKRACHHDYVFISEIRIYFPTCIQPVDPLRDWTSRTHLYLLSSPTFFLYTKDKDNWPLKISTWKDGHEFFSPKLNYPRNIVDELTNIADNAYVRGMTNLT